MKMLEYLRIAILAISVSLGNAEDVGGAIGTSSDIGKPILSNPTCTGLDCIMTNIPTLITSTVHSTAHQTYSNTSSPTGSIASTSNGTNISATWSLPPTTATPDGFDCINASMMGMNCSTMTWPWFPPATRAPRAESSLTCPGVWPWCETDVTRAHVISTLSEPWGRETAYGSVHSYTETRSHHLPFTVLNGTLTVTSAIMTVSPVGEPHSKPTSGHKRNHTSTSDCTGCGNAHNWSPAATLVKDRLVGSAPVDEDIIQGGQDQTLTIWYTTVGTLTIIISSNSVPVTTSTYSGPIAVESLSLSISDSGTTTVTTQVVVTTTDTPQLSTSDASAPPAANTPAASAADTPTLSTADSSTMSMTDSSTMAPTDTPAMSTSATNQTAITNSTLSSNMTMTSSLQSEATTADATTPEQSFTDTQESTGTASAAPTQTSTEGAAVKMTASKATKMMLTVAGAMVFLF